MIRDINSAQTEEDIISIIDPAILAQIPAEDLKVIAANILLEERYHRNEVVLFPFEVVALRIYSLTSNQITQIEYQDAVYKVTG
ncbi:hypothetical protein ACSBL2_00350 [Pedobacter sp. AW31-3R]|uniref:hypothetical protein n=1 Tax=Pedobacter sp. AW31-3R TaxID=3445781 RepID=UPI003FA112A2